MPYLKGYVLSVCGREMGWNAHNWNCEGLRSDVMHRGCVPLQKPQSAPKSTYLRGGNPTAVSLQTSKREVIHTKSLPHPVNQNSLSEPARNHGAST